MCSVTCLNFAIRNLARADVAGRRVLEVGCRDVNGSVRPLVATLEPAEYVGVDIEGGPGVDVICSMEELEAKFGRESFDVVITTEVLEHVRPWRAAVSNLKAVCRPSGTILLTTRSLGFAYHAFPHDYWRYELGDMRALFADCHILSLESDPTDPGVFIKVRKPATFKEAELGNYELYSIVLNRRAVDVSDRNLTPLSLLRVRTREKLRLAAEAVGRRLGGRGAPRPE